MELIKSLVCMQTATARNITKRHDDSDTLTLQAIDRCAVTPGTGVGCQFLLSVRTATATHHSVPIVIPPVGRGSVLNCICPLTE